MEKVVLSTNKGNKGQKKFKINKGSKKGERDIELDVTSGSDNDVFIVETLDPEELGKYVTIDGKSVEIEWFNNFQIKKESTSEPINQNYKVKIVGLKAWKDSGKAIVLQDGNVNGGKPYVFTGDVTDDTIDLSDGDPGVGGAPPSA